MPGGAKNREYSTKLRMCTFRGQVVISDETWEAAIGVQNVTSFRFSSIQKHYQNLTKQRETKNNTVRLTT
jgi:hypothetical protein